MVDETTELAGQLDQRLVELQSLFELSKTLNSSLNLNKILDTLLLTPMGRMMIAQGAILLHTEKELFRVTTVKGISRELVSRVVALKDGCQAPTRIAQITDAAARGFFEKLGFKLACPIISNNQCIGLILLGEKITRRDFSADEVEYLFSMANLAAPSIDNSRYIRELQEVNRQLDKKIQELNTLFEIGKELNTTLDQEKIANILAYAIMGEMMVQRCVIVLEKASSEFDIVVAKGYRQIDEVPIMNNQETLQKLIAVRELSQATEVQDAELRHLLISSELSLVVPMLSQDKVRGFVLLGGRLNATLFQESEYEFLRTLGNAAMISLENARLFAETIEKQRLEEELSIARDIQRKLLPAMPPQIDGFDFAGINVPSHQVGGDYYDFIRIDESKMAITIGDVSGKGVPASLLMANLQASLHAMIHAKWPLSEIVFRINNIIFANTTVDKFITFFLAIIDTAKRELTFVNAGHNPPMLIDASGKIRLLETGGLILGMMKGMPYQQETIKLESRDRLVLFTDGVSEAMNRMDEEFTEAGIEKVLRATGDLSATEFIARLEQAVREFSEDLPQADDITILAVRVL